MYRVISIALAILVSFCMPAGAAYVPVRSDSFSLQAGYGESMEVSVKEIPAQSNAYIAGMPFDIEERLVQYGATPDGRRIATIDLISNTPFTLEISGPEMTHLGGESTEESLHYILNFNVTIGSYENGTSVGHQEEFSFRSRSAESVVWTPSISNDEDTFLGSVNGYIYFMFDQETSNFISTSDDTSIPPGEYGADVVITIMPDEGVQV